MNYKFSAVLAPLLMLSACSTSTRLGHLIPKHPNSEQVKGEETFVSYLKIRNHEPRSLQQPQEAAEKAAEKAAGASKDDEKGKPDENYTKQAAGAAIATFAAGLIIDGVKSELDREAEKYEKQSSARGLLNLDDLGEEGYLIYGRFTEAKKSRVKKPKSTDASQVVLGEVMSQLFVGSAANEEQKANALSNIQGLVTTGKVPQMLLIIHLKREAGLHDAAIFRAAQPKLWVAGVGAKVVGFNGAKPWTYLGALLLDTGHEAEVDLLMHVKGLQLEKVGAKDGTYKAAWVQVEPSSTLLSGTKVNLDSPGKIYKAGPLSGSWLAIPSIRTEHDEVGYIDVSFSVTEKDPSNVKKHIKKGSEYVENNKKSWLDWVKDKVGGN